MSAEITEANLKRLPGSTKDEIIAQVNREIDQSDVILNPWKGKIVTYNELYQLVQRRKHYEGLSNIFVPEILRSVETIVAKLYQIIVSSPNWFEYTGRDKDDAGSALALTQLTRYQMEENGFKHRLMDSLRQMVVSGLTVRKILWDFKQIRRKRTNLSKRFETDKITKKKRELKSLSVGSEFETIQDHWVMEPVDLLSFHISDVRTPYNDLQKARWIAEEYSVDKRWVRERVQKNWFKDFSNDELEDNRGKDETSKSEHLKNRRETAAGYSLNQSFKKNEYSIRERWGLLPAKWVHTQEELKENRLDEDDEVEGVIYILNRKILLKVEANPFWHNQKPYVSCPYVPKEFDFAGIGAAQIGEKLQEELNDTRNQVMDNKTLILMNMWLKGRSSGIKNADLRIRPNGVIPTNDMDGLTPLRPPILVGVGVNIENIIKEDLRQSVGAASNLQGIAQKGVDTATESSIINRESLGRLILTAELYGELVLKKTLLFAEFLNYQFYDHIKVIKLIGGIGVKYRKLSPEEIAGGYKDVIIRVSTDAADNPGVKRQQFMNFQNIVFQMQPEQMAFHWKSLNKLYGLFFPGRSLTEVYDAPVDKAEFLTVEEKVDMILAEQPVIAQPGENHQAQVQGLKAEFDDVKFALNPIQLQLFMSLIQSHEVAFQQEVMAQQEAQLGQLMQASAGQKQSGGSGQAGGTTKGKAPNDSPSTQTSAPSEASLQRDQEF